MGRGCSVAECSNSADTCRSTGLLGYRNEAAHYSAAQESQDCLCCLLDYISMQAVTSLFLSLFKMPCSSSMCPQRVPPACAYIEHICIQQKHVHASTACACPNKTACICIHCIHAISGMRTHYQHVHYVHMHQEKIHASQSMCIQ